MASRVIALLVAALMALAGAVAGPMAGPDRAVGAEPEPTLQVGVGRADITPPTGYFTMGNVRSDARAKGQHTRLQARAVVLERGDTKVALVVTDLCCVAGGLLTEAARHLEGRGIDERSMVVAGTHTHSAPGQYFPFNAHDVVFPNVPTPTEFSLQPDPQLYAFLAERIATAIARADDDLAPGAAAWGHTEIPVGLTENRSIEAHLANYGIQRDLGEGSASESPRGAGSTIDPDLDVLRVDKLIDGRLVPVGLWSTFANHGTVTLGSRAENYNGDHLGAAMLVAEDALRRKGGAPPGQDVVTAFSNADEGDTSSALHRTGPADAEYVGRVEAAAMLRAWTDAGARLSEAPQLGLRWTRFCFCGQETRGGRVDDKAVPGLPLLSGSDEHRGQLHENTGLVFEGERLPAEAGPQGNKIQLEPQGVPIPKGAPLAVVRVGDGVVVSNPGEVTTEVGRRIKDAVASAMSGTGVRSVAISGLANEYQGYFTTPEEYAWQAYEGGQTNFGKYSANLLVEQTGLLAASLADGRPAPDAYDFDPTNGLEPDDTPFPDGAGRGEVIDQPVGVQRLARASFSWRGGARGTDRPLDRAFVRVERRTESGWRRVDDDLGTRIEWRVEGNEQVPLGPGYLVAANEGRYTARWEVPLDAGPGRYRFVVTAKRYRLASATFPVARGSLLSVRPVRAHAGRAAFTLAYPRPEPYADLTWRPQVARGSSVTVRVAGELVRVSPSRRGIFEVAAPPGSRVVVPAGTVGDPYGNRTRRRAAFTAGEPTAPRPREPYPVLSPW
ncbi:neutral/alkaline non-lysosomal ceramidase N-terminal domain-containing protein [Nocardioides sp.]|uniref:neutral/alkaline non-lysosomal ceramidase N-terminal domain-containing protein n=1 Tax=Nocardioides sp. TaxID=35761 RepID=UPI002D7E708D|nr:neutral/alkaline non-lysosomal ceramidase N-terminal domain-containing protein [Nocardioides sp.]HET8959869.1 neutral/alkaline non-lysosomal ceramidase N-terminal domain-containing protein [Nocardioides sp.]